VSRRAVHGLYGARYQALLEWIDSSDEDLTDSVRPPEVRSLSRMIKHLRLETNAWHDCHFTKGLFEPANSLINRATRVAFCPRRCRSYPIGALLYVS
jgi:hypothetical protein